MNAAQDFEHAIRNAIAQGLQNGLSPIVMAGLMNFQTMDLRDSIKAQAAQEKRTRIVRGAIIPNGE